MTDPAVTMRQLRAYALSATAEDLDLEPTEARPRVWGAIMELGYATGIATLLSLADGTTSLYFSNGGGVIGAGENAAVREAAEAFLDAAETHAPALPSVEDTPTPRIGRVRLYVRTFEGTLGIEATDEELSQNRHPLSAVFHAGHAVITAIRENSSEA
ncbi:MAG TPA: hypothetical protein VFM00_12240 [Candidatus Eisenbacteria bacterium]|nr:hypothetical protein [Candidatus Eisenbacteria bacterium]